MPSSPSLASRALWLLAIAARVVAALLVALVVVLCLPVGELRPLLVGAQRLAEAVVAPPLRGLFVFAVPTGGAFRGDIAAMALVLLAVGALADRLRGGC